jgi:DNA-binding transcriptional ArsR family regulator
MGSMTARPFSQEQALSPGHFGLNEKGRSLCRCQPRASMRVVDYQGLTGERSSRLFNHMIKYKSRNMNRIFHALADPTRRQILTLVSAQERQASEIAASFKVSFPAVSKHLKVLEEAELISRRVQGRVHRFRIRPRTMKRAHDWLEDYAPFWSTNLDQLEKYLNPRKGEKA